MTQMWFSWFHLTGKTKSHLVTPPPPTHHHHHHRHTYTHTQPLHVDLQHVGVCEKIRPRGTIPHRHVVWEWRKSKVCKVHFHFVRRWIGLAAQFRMEACARHVMCLTCFPLVPRPVVFTGQAFFSLVASLSGLLYSEQWSSISCLSDSSCFDLPPSFPRFWGFVDSAPLPEFLWVLSAWFLTLHWINTPKTASPLSAAAALCPHPDALRSSQVATGSSEKWTLSQSAGWLQILMFLTQRKNANVQMWLGPFISIIICRARGPPLGNIRELQERGGKAHYVH